MEQLKKSQFIAQLYAAASLFNLDQERDARKDDEYRVSIMVERVGLTEAAHRWVEGKGYVKPCPISTAVMHLANLMRRDEKVSMKEATADFVILQEYIEGAWEEYEVLLARYKEVKAGLLQGLTYIAAENADRAGLRS